MSLESIGMFLLLKKQKQFSVIFSNGLNAFPSPHTELLCDTLPCWGLYQYLMHEYAYGCQTSMVPINFWPQKFYPDICPYPNKCSLNICPNRTNGPWTTVYPDNRPRTNVRASTKTFCIKKICL